MTSSGMITPDCGEGVNPSAGGGSAARGSPASRSAEPRTRAVARTGRPRAAGAPALVVDSPGFGPYGRSSVIHGIVTRARSLVLPGLVGLFGLGLAFAAPAQTPAPGHHHMPADWHLHWPAGDPARGRAAFLKFDCGSCHEVRGESFPAPRAGAAVGPELSAMGPQHPPEYFVEALVAPSATIEPGKGYAAPDGSSKMPAFNDTMMVQELIDLVAYLKSLRPPDAGPARSAPPAPSGHGVSHGSP
jgi:mono/diheme cytochrome c family protein